MSIEEQTFCGLKGQQHIAQGNALGVWKAENTPCKGKSRTPIMASALTGRKLLHQHTQGVALGCELIGLSGRTSMLYRSFKLISNHLLTFQEKPILSLSFISISNTLLVYQSTCSILTTNGKFQ